MRRRIHNSATTLNEVLFAPSSSWKPPTSFPNIPAGETIGFDTEGCDPHLLTKGPGFIRGDAKVAGFSVATKDASWYFPFDHLAGGNLRREDCLVFLNSLFKNPDRFIVGANLQYDLEAIWSLGVTNPQGRFIDIQVAEPLLEEEREASYSLESLCNIHLGKSKDESLLRNAASAYGVDPKSGLWKLNSKFVGAYAEYDAMAPLLIFAKQLPRLQDEGLMEIFELESKLLPILFKMRLQGIPVDLEMARGLSDDLKQKEDGLRDELKTITGQHIDVWSGKDLQLLCNKNKIWYGRTEKGNPSFTGDFLSESSHPILQKVAAIRDINRLRTTFVNDWIFGNEIRGLIHPQWKQLVSDDGGARTGRMAAANPNPMQVPARGELAPLVRKVFRRPGSKPWCKLDYSQQEPRILVHYAFLCKMRGAAEARDAYCKDRNMDIYKFLSSVAGISRPESKDLTLGRCYGMGKRKLAAKLGISVEAAEALLRKFDDSVPFVREIAEDTARKASDRGWIKTLCGRKRHFNYWEPVNTFDLREQGLDVTPVGSVKLAEAKWPGQRLRRAFTHKALNSLIQGSAADQNKSAVVQGYEEQGRIPYMVVHDEVNGPVDDQADAEKWQHLAENCVEMTVPTRADLHYGESWK